MPRRRDDEIVFHDPPKDGPITELFAFITSDESGDGIMAAGVADHFMPLVTSKHDIAKSLLPLARAAAKLQHKHVKLVRFTAREDIEIVNE